MDGGGPDGPAANNFLGNVCRTRNQIGGCGAGGCGECGHAEADGAIAVANGGLDVENNMVP
ncbi:hypothetical protein HaLaN_29181 [Haematococcus lacustris]|uniref:Uncharacterized protein n=1 Tax=Haematococcus lacustris TaxID=44745 RepID=A0A6A0AC79_HAELA|nr:hypothetical protein HaLaN_29181 [Haematococcus lacustris]